MVNCRRFRAKPLPRLCQCVKSVRSRRTIPIVADTYVDREFGTGALKITPGHDPNDFEIGQRLGLPIINVMNNDGTFNGNAGRFDGVERSEVRKQLWADLKVGFVVFMQLCSCAASLPCSRASAWASAWACNRIKPNPHIWHAT